MTNDIRIELRGQGTLVVGVYAGFIDTDLVAGFDVPKVRPEEVAAATIEGIRAGHEEVLADKASREIRAALDADPQALNRKMQEQWDAGQLLAWDASRAMEQTAQPQ